MTTIKMHLVLVAVTFQIAYIYLRLMRLPNYTNRACLGYILTE